MKKLLLLSFLLSGCVYKPGIYAAENYACPEEIVAFKSTLESVRDVCLKPATN